MKSIVHRAIAAIALLIPCIAIAHPEHEAIATFLTGFAHPWAGLDHALAAMGVGLLAARAKTAQRWALPVLFIVAMLAAFMLARPASASPAGELLIAISLIVLGAAYFLGKRIHFIGAAVVAVAAFGALHGYVHRSELPPDGSWLQYAAGLALATGIAHACGLFMGSRANPHIQTTAKIVAAVIASSGVFFLIAS
jgi:urease accessory protein